jgi:hypothetical protein
MKSSKMSPSAMHGPATSFDSDAEKMAQDKMMYGGTGPDGDNGNAMEMSKSCCNPGDPKTTGDGHGHWSGR